MRLGLILLLNLSYIHGTERFFSAKDIARNAIASHLIAGACDHRLWTSMSDGPLCFPGIFVLLWDR